MKNSFDFSRLKVLVVDDQRAFQITLKGVLTNLGIKKLHFVESSDAAIRSCRSTDYDVVLADYNLGPGKNGRQLLEALRDKQLLAPNAIFIIVSGENARGVVLGAIEREPDDYLVKPFSLRQLAVRLERAYNKHMELSEVYTALHVGDIHLAIGCCKRLIKAGSRYGSLCIKLLSDLYRRIEDYESSEKLLRLALEARDTVWARVSLGHTLNLTGRSNEVVELISPVIKESPLMVEAQDCIATAYCQLDDGESALKMLKLAASMSPYMEERQYQLASVARDQKEYKVAQEAYKQIFDLSQRAQEKNTEHLCNYVRSTVEASLLEENPNLARRLETEATNTLMRARQDAQYNGFDFQNYEDLVNANKWAHKGELLKAKKLYYKATERYDDKTADSEFPKDFLAESLNTVFMIGEFDEAKRLLEKAKTIDSKNPFLKSSVEQQEDEESGLKARTGTFQIHNKQGMAAYEAGEFLTAIEEFELALQLAPTNTEAALNLIQTLVKSLSESKKLKRGQLTRCKDLFKYVNGIRLPAVHNNRKKELWKQLQQTEQNRR